MLMSKNCLERRVHSVLSGEHSTIMEISAQAGEGGGARPPPFTISTMIPSRTYKLVVCTPAERSDTYNFILFLEFQ